MDRAILGHPGTNEAVALHQESRLVRYRYRGDGVEVVWEVDCPGRMIDRDADARFVDVVVRTGEGLGLGSWSWEAGQHLFTHAIPGFSEPWALATSPDGEWAAMAELDNRCMLVHRASGRLGARTDRGGDCCHTVSWSADGRRIGYAAGAIGGTGGGYVLEMDPGREVLPRLAEYDFPAYDGYNTVLLDREGSLALCYEAFQEGTLQGRLTLHDAASGAVRWTLTLDADVLGVDQVRANEPYPELILTRDALFLGTRGKVVVVDLERGTVRADVELGCDAFVTQFALAGGGEWLWYLVEEQVRVVRLAEAARPRVAPARPAFARDPERERAVRGAADAAVLQEYASWLIEQGDDRGELVQLACGLDPIPIDRDRRVAALEERFLAELEGPGLARAYRAVGHFEAGTLRALRATLVEPFHHRAVDDLAAMAGQAHLLFLETLFLQVDHLDTPALFGALEGTPMGPSLRHLVLSCAQSPNYTRASWERLYPIFPHLRTLDVSGFVKSIEPVDRLRLEGFTLRVTALRPDVLSSLLAAPWPLRHLHLLFLSWASPTDRIAPEMFLPLLEGAAHPGIEHLTVSDSVEEFNAELVELLLRSPLLGRLKSLGLNLARVAERQRERLTERGVRLIDVSHAVTLGGHALSPAIESTLALIPPAHLRALLAGEES